jgi:hypothetical protein
MGEFKFKKLQINRNYDDFYVLFAYFYDDLSEELRLKNESSPTKLIRSYPEHNTLPSIFKPHHYK